MSHSVSNDTIARVCRLILSAAQRGALRKAVFSKPSDKTQLKTVLSPKQIGQKSCLQAECFLKDNKVLHKNLPLEEAETLSALTELVAAHGQVNLLGNGFECEYRTSSSGKQLLLGADKAEKKLDQMEAVSHTEETNNREKRHILSGNEPFLMLLGVADKNGRVYDRKQAKFRQINRFLELIRDVEDRLPSDRIRICDLCCGKSYLSFAAYHYFANIRGMEVSMTGVDLKPDVIEHCSKTAKALGFDGLEFLCGDIAQYVPEEKPQLVISLHACDIATDLVLCRAADWRTDVILSTPCCHHELNHSISCETLSFITDYSMLRQKLCDAATDALRLCRLEAEGYETSAIELIDPDETPKNIMLRALRRPDFRPDSKAALRAKERYLAAREFLLGGTSADSFHF